MSRLQSLALDQLTEDQLAVLNAINGGPRGGGALIGLVGPFGVWVRAPRVGMAIQALGGVARFDTSIAEDVKEVAICVVGAHHQAKFEFAAHARLARDAGVDSSAIDDIREGRDPDLHGAQSVAWSVATELMDSHRLTNATYAQAISQWGEEGMIELVSVVGYYCLVSLTLNAFNVPVLDNMKDPFPDAS